MELGLTRYSISNSFGIMLNWYVQVRYFEPAKESPREDPYYQRLLIMVDAIVREWLRRDGTGGSNAGE